MTDNGGPDLAFTLFISVWIAIVVGLGAFLEFNRDAALKRRVFPAALAGAGILLLVFLALAHAAAAISLVAIPVVALASFLAVKRTRFCDGCGHTVRGPLEFGAPRFCSSCGAPVS